MWWTHTLLTTFIYNLQHVNYVNRVVHCMPSTYLTYNWKFVPFDYLCHQTNILGYHWLYSPHLCALRPLHFILMTHLFCNWRLVPLTLPHLFLSSPNILPLWQSPVCFLQLSLCFCFLIFINLFCILDSTCKWNHTVFVILLSDTFRLILSRSIQIFADGKILFFIGSNVPLCLCICMSNIPCVNIHNGIIYSCMCACLVWKNTQKQNRWIECYSIFNFVRILHNVFHRACTSLHSTIHQ